MKIAIAGAGALGCRLGYRLFKAGKDVRLIDRWPEHIEAIRQKGLVVDYNGERDQVAIPIYFPEEVNEQVDVVIVLTKAMQLADMLQAVKPLFHENTKVVCLLNGLGHEQVIQQYVSKENIMMGTTIWTAGLVGPGHALLNGNGNMALQNFVDTDAAIEAAKEIVEILDDAGLQATYSEDVKFAIWKKACVNACGNAPTALLETDLGGFFDTPYTKHLVTAIITEFSQVAETQNVTLKVDEIVDFVITASLKVREHHASMYQDLVQNRRLTEVDYINGEVSRLGKIYGIATPVNDTITALVHMKEQWLSAK